LWVFVPASGSVIENAMRASPTASRGSHSARWASLPCLTSSWAQIDCDTINRNEGVPAAASSSHTIASSVIPAPAPPNSSGMCTPR
jgi:hypothetical protein